MTPIVENFSYFQNRKNVQFMKVINRNNIIIEIWERSTKYTYVSGSSTPTAFVAYNVIQI